MNLFLADEELAVVVKAAFDQNKPGLFMATNEAVLSRILIRYLIAGTDLTDHFNEYLNEAEPEAAKLLAYLAQQM